jgi:hypothetical protein
MTVAVGPFRIYSLRPLSHGEFWSAASALATIAASLITTLSLLFLVIQLCEQRRYNLAEFVNGLGKEFADFDCVFEVLLLHRDGPTRSCAVSGFLNASKPCVTLACWTPKFWTACAFFGWAGC